MAASKQVYAHAALLLLSLLTVALFPWGAPCVAHAHVAPLPAIKTPPRGLTSFGQRMLGPTEATTLGSSVVMRTPIAGRPRASSWNTERIANSAFMNVPPVLLQGKHVLMPGRVFPAEKVAEKTAYFVRMEAALHSTGGLLQQANVNGPLSRSAPSSASLSSDSSSGSDGIAFTARVLYPVTMLLCSSPSLWEVALMKASLSVSSSIKQAVEEQASSARIMCEVTVEWMEVLGADPSRKTIGNGSGGLLVGLTVDCHGTSFMRGRFLDSDEFASSLLFLNTTNITAVLQNATGSSAVAVVCATLVPGTGDSFICNIACQGMIAMGCVLLGLIAACVIITLSAVCCPCYCVRTDWEKSALLWPVICKTPELREPTTASATSRSIDADDTGTMQPSPSTMPHRRNPSGEPLDA
ncbi:hypothetical protein LSCM1_06096 [Leishmania martiniquensis]|uniref:Membrane-associated protein n=1 Tax=Leishmania martiniquensis TaxID=1580590 RepID=A0A836GB44_9TRYP|nr:hypothetical protein LSCM1_06096 [Leishmania martiniquensis]